MALLTIRQKQKLILWTLAAIGWLLAWPILLPIYLLSRQRPARRR